MTLQKYLDNHKLFFNDRAASKIMVFVSGKYKVFNSYYELYSYQKVLDREFICMDVMLPLFEDERILKIYLE